MVRLKCSNLLKESSYKTVVLTLVDKIVHCHAASREFLVDGGVLFGQWQLVTKNGDASHASAG